MLEAVQVWSPCSDDMARVEAPAAATQSLCCCATSGYSLAASCQRCQLLYKHTPSCTVLLRIVKLINRQDPDTTP
jgi:hypothetical protein